jgi:hypothetical protein
VPDIEISDHHGLDFIYILSALAAASSCTKINFPGNI